MTKRHTTTRDRLFRIVVILRSDIVDDLHFDEPHNYKTFDYVYDACFNVAGLLFMSYYHGANEHILAKYAAWKESAELLGFQRTARRVLPICFVSILMILLKRATLLGLLRGDCTPFESHYDTIGWYSAPVGNASSATGYDGAFFECEMFSDKDTPILPVVLRYGTGEACTISRECCMDLKWCEYVNEEGGAVGILEKLYALTTLLQVFTGGSIGCLLFGLWTAVRFRERAALVFRVGRVMQGQRCCAYGLGARVRAGPLK